MDPRRRPLDLVLCLVDTLAWGSIVAGKDMVVEEIRLREILLGVVLLTIGEDGLAEN